MSKSIAFAAAALMMSSIAFAHGNHASTDNTGAQVAAAASAPVSRAEVLADLEVYRQSGLAALDSRDAPDVYGADYQQAQARYKALRSSPTFAMAVARIAHERGDAVAAAGGAQVASAH